MMTMNFYPCTKIMIKLYLAVTNDEYELPVCVSDCLKEFSDMIGISKHGVLNAISRGSVSLNGKYRIIKIEVEDDL